MERIIIYLQNKCNRWFRLSNILKKRNAIIRWTFLKILIRVVYPFYSFFVSIIFGAYFPYQARIGKNIFWAHSLYGIFISQNSKIGDNCIILHHVTIGSNPPKDTKGPIIKDNVFIGCNSNIIGKSIIGRNSMIGAGTTIVNSLIPNNATVVGEKCKVILKNEK